MNKRKRNVRLNPRKKSRRGSWSETAAKVSGAVLGGIVDNIPGAIAGYKLAGKAYKMTRKKSAKQTKVNKESTGLINAGGKVITLNSKSKNIKTIGTYQYRNINQWMIVGTQGGQVVDHLECLFTRDQTTGIVTNGLRADRERWHDNPFELNPYVLRGISPVYPNAIANGSRNDVICIKSAKVTCEVLSLTKIPQNVIIYWMMPKYDTEINPVDSWANIMASKAEGQSGATTATAVATTSVAAGAANILNPGQNPFQHKEFSKTWKALSVDKLTLQAGEQINLKKTFTYNKLINKVTVAENRTHQYLAGLTIFPVVISRAGLVGLVNALVPETGASEVAYGQAKLGVIVNQDITFGALPAPKQSTSRVFYGTLFATTEQERFIDDQDQVADPSIEA